MFICPNTHRPKPNFSLFFPNKGSNTARAFVDHIKRDCVNKTQKHYSKNFDVDTFNRLVYNYSAQVIRNVLPTTNSFVQVFYNISVTKRKNRKNTGTQLFIYLIEGSKIDTAHSHYQMHNNFKVKLKETSVFIEPNKQYTLYRVEGEDRSCVLLSKTEVEAIMNQMPSATVTCFNAFSNADGILYTGEGPVQVDSVDIFKPGYKHGVAIGGKGASISCFTVEGKLKTMSVEADLLKVEGGLVNLFDNEKRHSFLMIEKVSTVAGDRKLYTQITQEDKLYLKLKSHPVQDRIKK